MSQPENLLTDILNLYRALELLDVFIDSSDDSNPSSLLQTVKPYLIQCITRYKDLEAEAQESQEELSQEAVQLFEGCIDLLKVIREKVVEGKLSYRNERNYDQLFDGFNGATQNQNGLDSRNQDPESSGIARMFSGIVTGNRVQTRFNLIPAKGLSKGTVAGIRDMSLGVVKNGKRVGKNVIRFDPALRPNRSPHISIDPRGHPSAKNLHIEIPGTMVKGAEYLHTTMKYAGPALLVASLVIDTCRVFSSVKQDINKKRTAEQDMEKLEKEIRELEEAIEDEEMDSSVRFELIQAIKEYKECLEHMKRTANVPENSIKTTSSIAGGWTGGAAGGSAGVVAGTQTGAFMGAFFGPAGILIGSVAGAVIGGIAGGIGGGVAGSVAAEKIAEKGLETYANRKKKEDSQELCEVFQRK